MLSNRFIKNIELGPQQMTFGFEGRDSKNFDLLFSLIEKEYKAEGPVALDSLISSETLPDALSMPETLQIIFWLAEELKIHFFINDRTLLSKTGQTDADKKPG